MFDIYVLMHKNTECATLFIDRDNGNLVGAKDFDKTYAPFLGNANEKLMKRWWAARAIPGTRKDMESIIRAAGCDTNAEYLAKNLALSITDTYWIRPGDTDLRWEQVNLFNNVRAHDGLLPYHNATSYDPNASLNGQMEKYWNMNENPPVLVKTGNKGLGQQGVNEVFATMIHERQKTSVPFVKYTAEISAPGETVCFCPAFTSEKSELVPAMEVLDSEKIRESISLYDAYIDIACRRGVDREIMQNFMDYQTLTDFLISNTDEHLVNFGMLRDPDTMELTGPAPIFDSGNSMFYTDNAKAPYTRAQILDRKITAIHDTEERMLLHVKNREIVKLDLLPEKNEVINLYCTYKIPEEKAVIIAENYATKTRMLEDLQHGKKISLYLEKQAEKKKPLVVKEQKTLDYVSMQIERLRHEKTFFADFLPKSLPALNKTISILSDYMSGNVVTEQSLRNFVNEYASMHPENTDIVSHLQGVIKGYPDTATQQINQDYTK